MTTKTEKRQYVSTTNACKLCKPLGACLAFRGIEGAVPFLHGSQGCATYMRRYIISHFNEPIDIGSSALGEKHAVFGGGANLKQGLANITAKYQPQLIGVATTCLTETIGDDVAMLIKEYRQGAGGQPGAPLIVNVSTPSYSGTHMEGFHAAVRAVVAGLAEGGGPRAETVAVFPGFISPADTRYLKEVVADFGLEGVILPDLSETLDAPVLRRYELIPAGGTPLAAVRALGRARAAVEFGRVIDPSLSAAEDLAARFGVERNRLGPPIGIAATDRFFTLLAELSGQPVPERHARERGRLIDSLVDGHKYVFGKRAIVYGEEDLVASLTGFLAEIGIQPVLCASGGKSGRFAPAVAEAVSGLLYEMPEVRENVDFYAIGAAAEALQPDLVIGHSKGYTIARKLGVPLIRVGFPIHDRLGGQRLLLLGYRGAQALFDRIVNALIEQKQDSSPVGYSYM